MPETTSVYYNYCIRYTREFYSNIISGRQVPIFSYYFLFFNKFLFIPIFQENSYFFLFLVMIMYFKSLNVVDHMEND